MDPDTMKLAVGIGLYFNCTQHMQKVTTLEKEIDQRVTTSWRDVLTGIKKTEELVSELDNNLKLLEKDLQDMQKYFPENQLNEEQKKFRQEARAIHKGALAKIGIYREGLLVASEKAPVEQKPSQIKLPVIELHTATYEQLDQYRSFLSQVSTLSPTERTLLHEYLEKAASILEAQGQKARAFALRQEIAEALTPASTHVLLQEVPEAPRDLSTMRSGFDAGCVKRGTLSFSRRSYEGNKKRLQLRFHVTRPYEQKLKNLAQNLKKDTQSRQEFERHLPKNLQGKIKVEEVTNAYEGRQELGDERFGDFLEDSNRGLRMGNALKIHFEGVGTVTIGQGDFAAMNRRVVVQVQESNDPQKALRQIHAMLTVLGLGPILETETEEAETRKQIALLLHTFSPQTAYTLQQSNKFYELSIENLIKEAVSVDPSMQNIFDQYLSSEDLFKKVSLSPSQHAVAMSDIAPKMQQKGAVGLMSGFSGGPEIFVAIVTHGMLCSQERFENGLMKQGTSPGQDHGAGGAGSVFARLITKKMLNSENSSLVERFPHFGDYQCILDLSAVERGAYAYAHDRYGSKAEDSYPNRPTLLALSAALDATSRPDNEVMIPERIPPEKIKHVLVPSAFAKKELIKDLLEAGLAEERGGKTYLKGGVPLGGGNEEMALEDFIITGRNFKENMWTS